MSTEVLQRPINLLAIGLLTDPSFLFTIKWFGEAAASTHTNKHSSSMRFCAFMSTSSDNLPNSFLRLAKSWVLLPLLAYLFAIPGLGPAALFVPIVISRAPLGIISYFDKVTLEDHQHSTEIAILHCVFWILFFAGTAGRQTLPLWLLRSIWAILVIMLFMSVSGCTREFGAGFRNDGNWH